MFDILHLDIFKLIFDYLAQPELIALLMMNRVIYQQVMKYSNNFIYPNCIADKHLIVKWSCVISLSFQPNIDYDQIFLLCRWDTNPDTAKYENITMMKMIIRKVNIKLILKTLNESERMSDPVVSNLLFTEWHRRTSNTEKRLKKNLNDSISQSLLSAILEHKYNLIAKAILYGNFEVVKTIYSSIGIRNSSKNIKYACECNQFHIAAYIMKIANQECKKCRKSMDWHRMQTPKSNGNIQHLKDKSYWIESLNAWLAIPVQPRYNGFYAAGLQ